MIMTVRSATSALGLISDCDAEATMSTPLNDKKTFDTRYDKKANGCWEWRGRVAGNGYASFSYAKKIEYAHRMSYRFYKGEIPCGLLVCHTCDNRRCVNPDHLFLGTYKDNFADMRQKGRSLKGDKSHKAKFTDDTIFEALELHDFGVSMQQISLLYDMSMGYLYEVKHGTRRVGWKERYIKKLATDLNG